ncbi:hypothetical protein PUF88_06900 [Lactobacillaceae bacterium L1_55_11]|nr:hypothetical protein [Lactobacillaceae bacterium L1_55_11]
MGAIKAVSKTALVALLGFGLFASVQASADSGDLQPFTADSTSNPLQEIKPFSADTAGDNTAYATPDTTAQSSATVAKTNQGSGYTKPDSDVPYENILTAKSNFFGDPKVTNNQSNGVVTNPKSYSNDVDAANDLRQVQPVDTATLAVGNLLGDVKNLDSNNKQTTVNKAPFAVTGLGANSKDLSASQFNTAGLTHTQLSNNGGTAVDQYYDPATKALSLVMNGKLVTISNGDYTVVSGSDGKQYKVFNPGTGSALVQDESFAEKKAAASEAETMVANNIFPKAAVTGILLLDSAIQVVSNIAIGVIDAVWTAINSVAFAIASIATGTWFGALGGIPAQAIILASMAAQTAFREAWRGADEARRAALYALIPALVGPAYTAQLINNYNTNRVANGTKQDNEAATAANASTKAITEPNTVNKEAEKASAATIADATFITSYLVGDTIANTVGEVANLATNTALTAGTIGVGALTAGLGAIPIAGGIAQAIGAPITIAGDIAGSVLYDAQNVVGDTRRAIEKAYLIGSLWATNTGRVADMYHDVIDAANNGQATVYKLA